jgi:hypothetical protein
MIQTTWRTLTLGSIRLAVIALAMAPWAFPGRAEAQYGGFGGFGYGYGWGGYNQNAYSDVNYLNQRSLINASAAANSRPQPLNDSPLQSRDESFYDKYDLETREAMIDRVARDPGRERGTADPSGVARRPSTSSTTAKPARSIPPPPTEVHLADYFSKDQQLIWPSVAPISGDLGKKQATADLAALAVLNEYNMKGLAQLSTVTNARQKLLDYGRPALQQVREQSTPAIADSFHVFLLALYNNLGNAATVPKVQ